MAENLFKMCQSTAQAIVTQFSNGSRHCRDMDRKRNQDMVNQDLTFITTSLIDKDFAKNINDTRLKLGKWKQIPLKRKCCVDEIFVTSFTSSCHWGQDKMAVILQMAFSEKEYVFGSKCRRSSCLVDPDENLPVLIQVIVWHRQGDKPLP